MVNHDNFWNELLRRATWIRSVYSSQKIQMPAGEGLPRALDEAEACARGTKKPGSVPDADVTFAISSCHVVWALYDSIKGCLDAGLNVRSQLTNIATGTTDYGVPADPRSAKAIFFKDFEAELFIAARLAAAGLPVTFLEEANDPRGDMKVQSVLIEVKQPNSVKIQERLMRKFNGQLQRDGSFGVFVTAVEDAFQLAPPAFLASQDLEAWRDMKANEIEAFGLRAVSRAAALPRIGVLAQTSSCVEIVGNETKFMRRSNALIFDNKLYDPDTSVLLARIAAIFNPHAPRYSQIRDLLFATTDPVS